MSNGIPSRYIPTGKRLHGGMGEVLVCEDTNLERQVVIKFIQDVKDQRRLFDEITALQNIRSKHVVQIFDIFLNEIDRRIGIVQEYVPGSDLVNCQENSVSEPEYLNWTVRSSRKINEFTRVSAPNAPQPSSGLTITERLSLQGF